jgi:hypothetical protein
LQQLTFSQRNPMQFRHPESYRILQDPMGSGVGYMDLGSPGRANSLFFGPSPGLGTGATHL